MYELTYFRTWCNQTNGGGGGSRALSVSWTYSLERIYSALLSSKHTQLLCVSVSAFTAQVELTCLDGRGHISMRARTNFLRNVRQQFVTSRPDIIIIVDFLGGQQR